MTKVVRVLVVDDSATLRQFVLQTLEAQAGIEVCGTVGDGRGLPRAIARHEPDVVVLDVQMPHVDGVQATREVMTQAPRPIVLFCGIDEPEAQARAFEALRLGAVTLVPKPGPGLPLDAAAHELVDQVRVAAGVVPITRRGPGGAAPPAPAPTRRASSSAARAEPQPAAATGAPPRAVAIAASTGGPQALQQVLAGLGPNPPAPVLIVQHITPDFVESFVRWLNGAVPQTVRLARDGDAPAPGHVYVAPGHVHLALRGRTLALEDTPPECAQRPAGDVLLRSVAQSLGAEAIGVVLTGMGADGAQGLLAMHQAGAWTIAQDAASAVVDGMPRVARELGAARQVLALDAIGPALRAGVARARATGGGK